MADGFNIEIRGLAELKATFESLATKAADRCVARALMAGAVVEQAAISEAIPVNETGGGMLPEGALKNDIEIHKHRSEDGHQYLTVSPGKYTQHVALWVEYGHRLIRGGYSKVLKDGTVRGPGTEIGFVSEKSYIRDSYEKSREAVADAISTTLATEIEASAARKGK